MTEPKNEHRNLLALAVAARKHAFVPCSNFPVGCAIEDMKGNLFTGCNVELPTHIGSSCAERTTIVKMVSEGGGPIKRLWVVGKSSVPTPPCGVCRQSIYEFGPDAEIIYSDLDGTDVRTKHITQLLPEGYSAKDL